MRHLLRLAPLALLFVSCAGSPPAVPAPAAAAQAPLPAPTLVELPPDLEARLGRLAAELERQRESLHLPGLAAVVVHGDEVLWIGGLGAADLEGERAVEPSTLFQIGSTSKAFTATLLGQLVDAGQADWDDAVSEHLPRFEPPVRDTQGRKATLRDLLCHRTGFTRMGLLWAGGQASRSEILLTANGAEPWADFRARFLYNNVMYLAAGEAAAAAADTDWDTLLGRELLAPLGMDSTSSRFAAVEHDPRLALGYRWNEDTETLERDPRRNLDSIAPAGAIQSNVIDMAKWVRMLLAHGRFEGRQLVSAEALAETWAPQIQLGPDVHYGLGWFLRDWKGRRYVEHGGNIDGFCAQVCLLPDDGLGAVLLANVGQSQLQGTFGPLVFETLLGEAPAEDPSDTEAEHEDFTPFLGKYIANFASFRDTVFEVKLQNEKLAIDIPGQMVFELQPPDEEDKRTFTFTDQVAIRFLERDGEVTGLEMHQAGFTFEVPREGVETVLEIPLEELTPFLGRFKDPAFEEPIEVVIQNKHLAVAVPGQQTYELRPPNDEGLREFRISPLLGLEFHADEAGGYDSLTFHERGSERLCRRLGEAGPPAPLPTLEEVLEMRRGVSNEKITGALGGLRLRAEIRFLQAGIRGTSTTLFDGQGRFHDDIDVLPFARLQSGFDGTTAWTASTLEAYDELEGASARSIRLSHPMALFGDWREHFETVTVLRTRTDAEGREHVHVRLKASDGIVFTVDVDVESGDLVAAESSAPVPGAGVQTARYTFGDWRVVDDLRLPFHIATENDSSGRTEVTFQSLESRLALTEDDFRYSDWR